MMRAMDDQAADYTPAPPWNDQERLCALAALHAWAGTPHRDRMATMSVGIDCLGLLREVATYAGILPDFRMPFYKPTWGLRRAFNIIERVLLTCCHMEKVKPGAAFAFGDVFVFKVGNQANHVGLYVENPDADPNPACWHAQAGRVVEPIQVDDRLRDQLQAVLRFTDRGFQRRPETLTQDDLRP